MGSEPPVQHNPVNRILLELRTNDRDIYDLMLDLDSRWAQQFPHQEIEHARDVLDRLANLHTRSRAAS